MKRAKSAVWKFFERIYEDDKCVGVVCKLCEHQYKFFGNTTNLRVHLINKHPIQWELSESGNFDETTLRVEETPAKVSGSRSVKLKAFRTRKVAESDKNVDELNQSDSEASADSTLNMVRQMHGDENSVEEWLEEDPYQITHIETFEPTPKKKRVKYRTIKREVQSPTGLPGYYVAPRPESSKSQIVYKEPTMVCKDEYSVFGEYVANKLRSIKVPRTRGNLQQLITTLLWQADYGLYDNAEAVKKVLMISMQSEMEPELVNNSTKEFEHTPVIETIIEDAPEESNQRNIDVKVDLNT